MDSFSTFRKPVVIIGAVFLFFFACMVFVRVDLRIVAVNTLDFCYLEINLFKGQKEEEKVRINPREAKNATKRMFKLTVDYYLLCFYN